MLKQSPLQMNPHPQKNSVASHSAFDNKLAPTEVMPDSVAWDDLGFVGANLLANGLTRCVRQYRKGVNHA